MLASGLGGIGGALRAASAPARAWGCRRRAGGGLMARRASARLVVGASRSRPRAPSCAGTSSARRSCAPQRRAAAPRPPQRAGALRPVPVVEARGRAGGAASRDRPRPAGRARRRTRWSRSSGPRAALGVAGSGWVARPGSWSPTRTSSPAQADTHVQVQGVGPGLDARGDRLRPARRHRGPAGRRAGAPPLPLAREPRGSAAILGFPLDGPYRVRAARLGRRGTCSARTPTGAGRSGARSCRCAAGCAGQQRRTGRGRPRARRGDRLRGDDVGPRGGYGVPNARVREALKFRQPVSPPALRLAR